jgi:HK97 family phage portal protein
MALFDFLQRRGRKKDRSYNINDPAFYEMLLGGSSVTVSPDTAMQLSTVYSCVKVLSETVATLPCQLFKVHESDGSKTIQTKHRLHRLVNLSPNDFMTASELWQWVMVCLALKGNAFVYVVRTDKGDPVELLPLHPDSVQINPAPLNRLIYVAEVGLAPYQRKLEIQQENMLHFKGMSMDGIRGVSPITANSALLSQAISARDHAGRLFSNGATPRGVLTTAETLSTEAYERIKQSWAASHQGVDNAHRVAILEAGLEFKPVSMSPEDVQLLEARKYNRSEIAGIYRVPPHMVGDLERATFDNISTQQLDFYRNAVAPWIHSIEQRLNWTLLGTYTQEFRFDVSELVRSDFDTYSETLGKLLDRGVLSPNEVRARLGYNPREGGDEYVSESNNLTFGNTESPDAEP